ncbi:MAG: hypothetical protein ABGX16_11585 [Pirellulales bacterium]
MFETRGEGGYTLAPGCPVECHPAGRTYDHFSGPPLEELPTITPEERRALLQAASTFDDSEVEESKSSKADLLRGLGLSPGDEYKHRAYNRPEILEPHGWVFNGDYCSCNPDINVLKWDRATEQWIKQ